MSELEILMQGLQDVAKQFGAKEISILVAEEKVKSIRIYFYEDTPLKERKLIAGEVKHYLESRDIEVGKIEEGEE